MAVNVESPPGLRPRWPSDPIDPARVDFDYDPPADEVILYFAGRPHGGVCDPINEPGGGDIAIIVDEESNEIVGIQVIPFLVGAVQKHPQWAILAWGALTDFRYEEEMLRAALGAFVAEVRELFDRHWTPPPPIEEQLARLTRAGSDEGGQGDG